jgi:sugar (pentulose or hexulose) kinase
MPGPAELLVGIDVGTTMTKAAVVRPDGTEVSWGSVPTPWHPTPSGAETDPFEFLEAVAQAVSSALEAATPGQVVGVGVTSMAETVALLGKDGLPVSSSIVWHDTRGQAEAEELVNTFGGPEFSARTGLPPSPLCTLVKLAWRSRQGGSPPVRALSVADWVVHALGGEQVSEASLASRMGALSLAGRSWWEDGLEWARVPIDLFPPVVQAGQLVGTVNGGTTDAATGRLSGPGGPLERLRGAAIAPAGHDHLCVAAGVGATAPWQLLDSCGTAEGFVRTLAPLDGKKVGQVVSAGLSVGWHTVPDKYALLGGQALGLLLGPVLSLLGIKGNQALLSFDQAATGVTPGPLRVQRERPFGSASIVGLGPEASPPALWNAALDLVSAGAEQILGVIAAESGPVDELVLTGGWAQSGGLRRRKRSLLARRRWPAVGEGGARGAALFGGCAAGLFTGPESFPPPGDLVWVDDDEVSSEPTGAGEDHAET